MSIIARAAYHPIISALYTMSAAWLGTVYWLFMASVIVLVLKQINTLTG